MAITGNDFRRFPLPGTTNLFLFDYIIIKGVTMPLDGQPEGGKVLDTEKRKSPGSDYSSYVSHGIDTTPIRIRLLLFRDMTSGADWWAEYNKIAPLLVATNLDKRNAIPVRHPGLNALGITNLIFTDCGIPQQKKGLMFTVSLSALNPATLRLGSSGAKVQHDTTATSNASTTDSQGKSKPVGTDKQNTPSPTARASKANYKGPAANNAGKALAPSQRRG